MKPVQSHSFAPARGLFAAALTACLALPVHAAIVATDPPSDDVPAGTGIEMVPVDGEPKAFTCAASFDQPVFNSVDRGAFSERGEFGSGSFFQQLAENFTVTTTTNVQGIGWSGSYYLADPFPTTTCVDFRIRFFTHDTSTNSPNLNPAYDELVSAELTPSGVIFEGRIIYSARANIPAYSAAAGQIHWISILEEDAITNNNPTLTWRWANSANPFNDAHKFRNTEGAAWLTEAGIRGNSALQIYGCTDNAITCGGPPPTGDCDLAPIEAKLDDETRFTDDDELADQLAVITNRFNEVDAQLVALEAKLDARTGELDAMKAALCEIIKLLHTPSGQRASTDVEVCGGADFDWNREPTP